MPFIPSHLIPSPFLIQMPDILNNDTPLNFTTIFRLLLLVVVEKGLYNKHYHVESVLAMGLVVCNGCHQHTFARVPQFLHYNRHH